MIFNTQQNDGQFQINDFYQDEVKQEEKKISSMNSNLRNDDSALHNGLAKMIEDQKVSDLPEYLHSSGKVQVEPTMPVEKYVSIFEAWIQYVKQVEGNQLRIDERQAYLYVKQNGLEILLESLQIYMKKGKIQYLGKLESQIQGWSVRNQQNLIDFQDSLFPNESNCEDLLNYVVQEYKILVNQLNLYHYKTLENVLLFFLQSARLFQKRSKIHLQSKTNLQMLILIYHQHYLLIFLVTCLIFNYLRLFEILSIFKKFYIPQMQFQNSALDPL